MSYMTIRLFNHLNIIEKLNLEKSTVKYLKHNLYIYIDVVLELLFH